MDPATLFLLKLLSPVLLLVGVSVALNRSDYAKMLKNLETGTATCYLIALLPLCVGLAIVLTHNRWNTPPEVIISLIGWGGILKGAARLIAPVWCKQMIAKFAAPGALKLMAAVVIVLGAYMGYTAYA